MNDEPMNDEQLALGRELHAAYMRGMAAEPYFVMDMPNYRTVRRTVMVFQDGEPEPDEEKWVPDPMDRLLGLKMIVRDDGGKPHVEWIERSPDVVQVRPGGSIRIVAEGEIPAGHATLTVGPAIDG